VRGKSVPAVAVEQPLVLLVGELGVVDAEAPLEVLTTGFGEAAVGLGVDARGEEAGDRMDTTRVTGRSDKPLEPAQVCLGDLTSGRSGASGRMRGECDATS
jgi:hypothetical protein